MKTRFPALAAALCAAAVLHIKTADAQWLPARLANTGSEPSVKTARIAASSQGGFHLMYSRTDPWQVRYRRWKDGQFVNTATIHSVFCPNGDISEAGNGDVHIVWENWDGSEQVGWARTSNGVNFQVAEVTGYPGDGNGKHPGVVSYGAPGSPNVLISSWDASGRELHSTQWNGGSWSPNAPIGTVGDNQYCVNGLCRSLKDGSVYRAYGKSIGGTISVCYKRFNGSYWEPEVVVAPVGFFARESIAVNTAGEIMIVWEKDEKLYYRLYSQQSGWSGWSPSNPSAGIVASGGFGWVTAVPGSNDFYLTYAYNQCMGRRYSSGWMPAETVAVGLAPDFTPDTHCSAGPDGTIYAVWEYWGSGQPQQYFSVRPGASGPTGVLTGKVRDQYGAPIPGVTVGSGYLATLTDIAGNYSLRLAAGVHSVTASKDYYAPQSVSGVTISEGATTPLDLQIAATPPASVSGFTAAPSSGLVRLYWTNPPSGNFTGTMIRYSSNQHPLNPTEGVLLADRTGTPGSSDSLTHNGLPNGTTVYYSAFAHDADGHFAPPRHAVATPHLLSCGEAERLPDGAVVDLTGKIVVACFASDGALYISEPDRSSAVRVLTSQAAVGDVVSVSGQVTTRVLSGVAAERQIANPVLAVTGHTGVPSPLRMTCRDAGGGSVGAVLPGVSGGFGANNMGLLVSIAGRVTEKVSSYVFVDDGSGIRDTGSRIGVMVRCPDSAIPANVGDMVVVTGVLEGSVPTGWSANRRLLHIRSYEDILVVGQ